MLLGSLVIFLAVFVNSLKSFNLRRISDLQSQNNYFYSVQHPVTVMENSLITEVPSPHFSSTKGPVSSVEIQNHSKQLDQLMNSRSNVTEDFALIKSRIKPLKIKRKFKNKRRIHKKVSNTRTRLHYTELKRLKSIHSDESNKLLNKGVINDSGKKHGSRAIKNILKNVDKKHNNIEKSADETSHVKNYLKRYFRCQKDDDDKCVQVKNKIIHSLHTAEYVTSSNVIRANKQHPLQIKEGQKIKKSQKTAAMLHQPTKLKHKNRSANLSVNNGIRTFAHTDKNMLISNKNIRQKHILRKNTENIKKSETNSSRQKYAVNKENNNQGTIDVIQENTKANTSILKIYSKDFVTKNIMNLKGGQFYSIYNITGQANHANTGNKTNTDFKVGKTTDLHINNSNHHENNHYKNNDHKKDEQFHSISNVTGSAYHANTENRTNEDVKAGKVTDFHINNSSYHKNRLFKIKLLKMEYIKLNSTQKTNNQTSSTEKSSDYLNMKRMLPEDMTEKSLVAHTSALSKLLLKRLEEYISIKNVTRIALTNYSSDLNSTNFHKYSLKSHKDANHSSTFFDNFSPVIVGNSNVSVNSTTQSANILKSNYNKSKEKATINFVTTPFLNYSELNKTGINYFRQYSKDVVFSGMSVKINGSSIKKNDKQPQSPKDVLYDLNSCSGVTKISVEAREREREYYLPPDELTFDEMALVNPSLSPIALSARAIKWTLFGKSILMNTLLLTLYIPN